MLSLRRFIIIPTNSTADYKRVYALPSGVPIPQARTFHSQVLSYIRSDSDRIPNTLPPQDLKEC
jgi:hypothetical protein